MSKYVYRGKSFDNHLDLSAHLNYSKSRLYKLLVDKSGDVTDIVDNRLKKEKETLERMERFSQVLGVYIGTLGEALSVIKERFGINFMSTIMTLGEENAVRLLELVISNDERFMLNTKESFMFDGKNFLTLKRFCNHYMIDLTSFRIKYVETHGDIRESIKLADSIEEVTPKYKFHVDGRDFNSIRELADFYGLSSGSLRNKIATGMDVETAIKYLQENGGKERDNFTSIKIDGVTFKTKTDITLHFKISHHTLNKLLDECASTDELIDALKSITKSKPKDFNRLMYDENTTLEDFLVLNDLSLKFMETLKSTGKTEDELIKDLKGYYDDNYIEIEGVRYHTPAGIVKTTGNGFHAYIFRFLDASTKPNSDDSDDLRFLLERCESINKLYINSGGTGNGNVKELMRMFNGDNSVFTWKLFSRYSWDLVEESIVKHVELKIPCDEERYCFINGKAFNLVRHEVNDTSVHDKLITIIKYAPTEFIISKIINEHFNNDSIDLSIEYVYGFRKFILKVFEEEFIEFSESNSSFNELTSCEISGQKSEGLNSVEVYSEYFGVELDSLTELEEYMLNELGVAFKRFKKSLEFPTDVINIIRFLDKTPFEFLIKTNQGPFNVNKYTFNNMIHFSQSLGINSRILLSELPRNNYNLIEAFYYAKTFFDFLYTGNVVKFEGEEFNSVNEICLKYGTTVEALASSFAKNRDFEGSMRRLDNVSNNRTNYLKISTDPLS